MQASLGDIVFDLLLGPDQYDDTRESAYAQIPLIGQKPALQYVFEKAQEITIRIQFKTAWCNPEQQYDGLEKIRTSAQVVPFIWGSGRVEGDFVIVSIKKSVTELDAKGNWQNIICDIALLENYTTDNVAATKSDMLKGAFATTLDKPRPANIEVTEPTNATDLMKSVMPAAMKNDQAAGVLDNATVQAAAKNTIYAQAQEFVDQVNTGSYQLGKLLRDTNTLLQECSSKLSINPAMQTIAPLLTAQIATTESIMSNTQTLVSGYGALPNPVQTLADANAVISVMNQTVVAVKDIKQTNTDLKNAAQPLVVAIATRQNV